MLALREVLKNKLTKWRLNLFLKMRVKRFRYPHCCSPHCLPSKVNHSTHVAFLGLDLISEVRIVKALISQISQQRHEN